MICTLSSCSSMSLDANEMIHLQLLRRHSFPEDPRKEKHATFFSFFSMVCSLASKCLTQLIVKCTHTEVALLMTFTRWWPRPQTSVNEVSPEDTIWERPAVSEPPVNSSTFLNMHAGWKQVAKVTWREGDQLWLFWSQFTLWAYMRSLHIKWH